MAEAERCIGVQYKPAMSEKTKERISPSFTQYTHTSMIYRSVLYSYSYSYINIAFIYYICFFIFHLWCFDLYYAHITGWNKIAIVFSNCNINITHKMLANTIKFISFRKICRCYFLVSSGLVSLFRLNIFILNKRSSVKAMNRLAKCWFRQQ